MRFEAYSHTADEVLTELGVDPQQGLSGAEVERRRGIHGWNRLAVVRRRSAWQVFLAQFASLVVGLLGVAAVVALLTGGWIEALAIVVVLLINAVIGFLMEWQAGQALEALRRQTRSMARVRRAGREEELDSAELVPGDVVILHPGDLVPADLRLVEAASLRVEESALTGESEPVAKTVERVARGALLAERYSMIFHGTSIAAGRAVGIVTETGVTTELGRIGTLVAETPDEMTPLRRKLDALGRQLVILVLGIGLTVVIAGISLAVAAVPEGLPAVTTLILALGVLRMARSNAIVRHLPAVETLGSATVICTDKTGTLTENRMAVREYRLADGRIINVNADGIEGTGQLDELWRRTMEAGVLCNEASPGVDGGAIGDPTEIALLEAASHFGLDITGIRESCPKIDEEPFDATTRRMITIHRLPDGTQRTVVKGAPSVILAMCSGLATGLDNDGRLVAAPLTRELQDEMERANEEMAGEALRVLAIAERPGSGPPPKSGDPERSFLFLGLVGMLDPPRPEAAGAIAQAYSAGIRIVMLTGDQLNTARSIAMKLGIAESGRLEARHAHDLATVGGAHLGQLAGAVQVFARVSPEDKLRIVEALKEAGEIVAVTGDGVNDAPALKRADIGIAMGQRGTEAAREASDIILTDDNFATIIRAVEGGRTIYANIVKFVQLMLSENLSEVVFIFLAILLGWPLPLLPLQILWVNLLTDIFPALALAVEPPHSDIMNRPPRARDDSLLSGSFFLLIGWQGIMLALIALGFYGWALEKYGPGNHARTIALFALIGGQLGHIFNCRSRTRSVFDGLFRNRFLWLSILLVVCLQLMAVFFAPLAAILGTALIDRADLVAVIGSVFLPIVIVEVVKMAARGSFSGRGPVLSAE
ncbi:MAG: cation-transporting P-type ATPase [Acidobacteria bacterium]|nr:cation-transporting P-type ATPase [Acidobacteriota bacterium]